MIIGRRGCQMNLLDACYLTGSHVFKEIKELGSITCFTAHEFSTLHIKLSLKVGRHANANSQHSSQQLWLNNRYYILFFSGILSPKVTEMCHWFGHSKTAPVESLSLSVCTAVTLSRSSRAGIAAVIFHCRA